ncbi:KHG/KDPG aldolase isoform X5 [Momordica charantia]|uniref:KHG/KDPG aldolase isoform X5 n=1 Tax=Momordica charantia TaxID=3673 RepID=A0A6J1CBA7_MOMCH|nr:KHG/KDPG aldolase isoform X5 [Momordica charantia]XP_022139081.1 KHG/KDPG aldolase isoform X5 [Momordica charantia]XP_022139082.1 KHG/KDPG aldolase isoform X5 [Momordica charantia]
MLEIVTSTPGVFEVLQQLLQDYPTKTVGVGTVLNIKDAKDAVKGGAKFLMSPTMVKGIMDDIEDEFLYIPGVMTPTEILTAYEAGAEIVKVYPVSALGGIKYISALKKPFPHISMVASQGITIDSIGDYIRQGASSVVLSDAIFNKEFMDQRNFDGIFRLSKLAASQAMEALEWKQQSSLTESCHR